MQVLLIAFAKIGNCRKNSLGEGLSLDAALLQQKLDSITTRNVKLESEYLDILQDKLGLETAIEDLREPSREPEENVPFLEQRKRLQATQTELADLKSLHFGLNAELASVKDRLIAAEQDRDGQSLDSNTEYQALTERYSELREHSQGIEAELAEQRSLVRHALLNPSALSREPAEIRSSNEYKIVVQQLHAVQEAPEDSDVLESTATVLTDKIETSRAESVAASKVSNRCREIYTLSVLTNFSSVPKTRLQRLLLSRKRPKPRQNNRLLQRIMQLYNARTSLWLLPGLI